MTFGIPTLWSDNGPDKCWENVGVRKVLDKARPPAINLHAAPPWMWTNAAALTNKIRSAMPDTEVWWSIAGAASFPNPPPDWARAARAAQDAGIRVYMPDPEGARWAQQGYDLARRSVDACRTAAPDIELVITSYGQPVLVPNVFPPPVNTGYSDTITDEMRGFVGLGSPVDAYFFQVYWAPDDGSMAPVGTGPRSQARSVANSAVMIADGTMFPTVQRQGYVQLHGCNCIDLCNVASQYDRCCFWTLNPNPAYYQQEGVWALCSITELHRRGYNGPGQIIKFQADQGLLVDNKVGPATRKALGVT